MKDQILESILGKAQNHDPDNHSPPPWSIQLLHCTFDLSPPDLFSFQQLVNLSGSDMGVLSLSRCWSFPLPATRWRVALFVEMCSAIQFHSSVSEESWTSARREGPVIERQWSSSRVPLFYVFYPLFVLISYIYTCMYCTCVCPSITASLLLQQCCHFSGQFR